MAFTIHEVKVKAPDELDITGGTTNSDTIRRWWEGVQLFTQAMQEVDRATIISYDPDTNSFYLSSIEAE